MKLLLTGFTPFPGVDVNPSQLIVEAIAAVRRSDVLAAVLPVAYGPAEAQIRRLLHDCAPGAVICLGVATQRHEINLERFALNINDATIADNDSVVADGRPIVHDGAMAYTSTLPLAAMRAALQARDIPVRISNHAGAYLCNHVFYVVRHLLTEAGRSAPSGFIHVPPIADHDGAPGLPLSVMVEAIEVCVDCALETAGKGAL
ncbi:MAG: pyroglutamyl-peptidase I [Anaerolineae bacterium]|nr:pyroglutamyl-peptidase I [Anaerolineae bacterium]